MIELVSTLPGFFILAGLSIIYAVFPYVSRQTLSFGVSIPESQYTSPLIVGMRARYRTRIIAVGVIILVAAAITAVSVRNSQESSWIAGIAALADLVTSSFIYLFYHGKMKTLKSQSQELQTSSQRLVSIETGFRGAKPLFNPWWFSTYALLITATAALSGILYGSLPERLAVRFDQYGNAIEWVDKSVRLVIYIPIAQVFMAVLFFFAWVMINLSRPEIDPGNKEKTLRQNIRFRYRWSVFVFVSGLLLLLLCALTQLSIMNLVTANVVIGVTAILTTVMIAAGTVLFIVNGQSGSRIRVTQDGEKTPMVRDDDTHWKFGVLYHNPDDAVLFVEKRVGAGWTVNWGRPAAWVIAVGLIVVIGGFCAGTFLLF